MESLAESMREQPAMPRFEDGSVNLRELIRRLAEDVVNAIMDAEADQLCSEGANSRNGYRERNLVTCVGDITMRIPKLRSGSFFPEDVVERYQRVDRAVVSAVAEMYATGTSTRKVQRIAEKLGISRLSKVCLATVFSTLWLPGSDNLAKEPPMPQISAFPSIKALSILLLVPLNSTSLPWWTTLSIIAEASLSSPRIVPHLLNSMLVVNTTLRFS